ncbi:hypothetical protein EDD68_103223 [Melghiribacillus thermohalophilus]|uniref:DUF3899 domain-containing protein n=1 Tax=Melghiribacillus thermohalophilus TaxID=1324956 RepID=A0A4R3N8Z7_9BACI|nr:hypothetical protein [Melghiribacillus thermohalophilus]TCT25668.1 hypothetical protein EDD68_103223 [Melghiribacillus thermohalophilus]
MKKWGIAFLTFVVILGVNWGIAAWFQMHVIEVSFFVGLAFAVILRLANSSGGFLSDSISSGVQSETGMKMERETKKTMPSSATATAVVYTILALIVTIIYYFDDLM